MIKTFIYYQNSFRYRRYYYDTETGLYCLQSRYYDPKIGRFINAGSMTDGGAGILGNNLYVYCANNPVNAFDPTGKGLWWIDGGKAIWGTAKQRTAAMLASPSAYTIGNWLTMGSLDTVKGSVAPEKPFSLQHWVDSAATALMILPAISSSSKGINSIINTFKPKPKDVINLNVINALPRTGSALKQDMFHAFPNIVDNYAEYAIKTPISNGTLYQLQGSLNGISGRYEWITQGKEVVHRMFVKNGSMNGIPIMP